MADAGKTIRILVAEDEELIRRSLSSFLKRAGLEAHFCQDGPSALAHYSKHWNHIHCVILDMVMPGMNGKKVLAEMSKINPQIKAIVFSGYFIEGKEWDVPPGARVDFLQKPFKTAILLEKIRSILA